MEWHVEEQQQRGDHSWQWCSDWWSGGHCDSCCWKRHERCWWQQAELCWSQHGGDGRCCEPKQRRGHGDDERHGDHPQHERWRQWRRCVCWCSAPAVQKKKLAGGRRGEGRPLARGRFFSACLSPLSKEKRKTGALCLSSLLPQRRWTVYIAIKGHPIFDPTTPAWRCLPGGLFLT